MGIDDWTFRRNHRCGTIVCDLERRRIVALLPDRENCDRSGVAIEAPSDQHCVARSTPEISHSFSIKSST